MQAAEFAILDWIRLHLTYGLLDVLMPAVTHLCDHGELWIALAILLLVNRKHRRLGACVACALILDLVFCHALLKPLVGRIRPFTLRPEITLLLTPPSDASFPSGHTACSFTAASAIWFAGCRKAGIAALALAAVIAFSRLYLYMHWPTDVLAGAVLGTLQGWLGVQLVRLAKEKLHR